MTPATPGLLVVLSAALFASPAIAKAADKAKNTAPVAHKRRTRIAVLNPVIEGEAPKGPRRVLRERLPVGLAASGMSVVAGPAVQSARPAGKHCNKQCVRRVARVTKTQVVVGALVKANAPFYEAQLWAADGQSGELVATVRFKCDVCPLAKLATKMELASSRLAVVLRRRAKKPAVIIVESDPAGAKVYIDDKLRGTTPLKVKVAPGAHIVELRAEGYYPNRREVRAVSAVEDTLRLGLIRRAKGSGTTRMVLGWSGIGAGLVAIGAGIAMLAIDGDATDCVATARAGEVCKANRKTAVAGWLLVGGGAALAGGGAALLLWPRGGGKSAGGSKSAQTALRQTGTISVAPTGLGLGLRGTF